MSLLPKEAGTMKAPAATGVPVGAVLIEETRQMSQPTLSNKVAPVTPSEELASAVSRGGTFVARMKRAKWSMSFKPSEAGVLSLGSETTSQKTSDVNVVGRQTIADTHLVQIGVARERKQRGVLLLPSKAAHGERPTGFQDGNAHGFTADEAACIRALGGCQVEKRLVGDRFNEAITKGIERNTERANGFRS